MQQPEIFIISGEISGDQLGSGLIKALKRHNQQFKFVGIGGKLMQEQGLKSLVPMEKLEVFGFVAVLKKLPELLKIRHQVKKYLRKYRPVLVIGIDAPDFNLAIENYAKNTLHLKTIHYISPSVWAWRQGRVKKIKQAVDHLLCILPFEEDFYRPFQVPATYIGHRLAQQLPIDIDHQKQRKKLLEQLQIAEPTTLISIVPGSRKSEVELLLEIYLNAIIQLKQIRPGNYELLIPMASKGLKSIVEQIIRKLKQQLDNAQINLHIFDGQIHNLAQASDIAIATSGTATLDLMLCHLPMVVGYKLSPINYAIYRRLVKAKYVSLVNLIFAQATVAELLQNNCNQQMIAQHLAQMLNSPLKLAEIRQQFTLKHQQMISNSDEKAAQIIMKIIND